MRHTLALTPGWRDSMSPGKEAHPGNLLLRALSVEVLIHPNSFGFFLGVGGGSSLRVK